jgi:succinyl-CoA synthetase beta subunit
VRGLPGKQSAEQRVALNRIGDPDGSVARAVEAIGRLAFEHEEVTEVDINPLIVTATGAVAVDALIVTSEECLTDE